MIVSNSTKGACYAESDINYRRIKRDWRRDCQRAWKRRREGVIRGSQAGAYRSHCRRNTRAGGVAQARELDVTSRLSMASFVQDALDKWGRVDVLINNAGIMPLSPLAAGKQDEWERMIDVNIKGVLWGIGAVLPVMEAQGSGQIINIGSIGALAVVPTAAVYCASKFAVRAISDGLRQESPTIRVTCVNPGVVESDLASTITHPQTRAAMDVYRSVALKPADIARAVRQVIEAPESVDTTEITIRPTASAN
jgi:NADP-dependent 3-hydroxy acid dehydrogenase YdfG